MNWHEGPFCAFDLETSGTDVETDRIVSAAAIAMDEHGATPTEWLSDADGIEIPAEATEIHGISTERARAEGRPAKEVIVEVAETLSEVVEAGVPIVGHNAVFDLTIMDRETRRHLGLDLWTAIGGQPHVIDTMVLDRFCAPFRRRISEKQGPYQLRTSAETYGLGWDEKAAHGAGYDALMAGRLVWHIGTVAHTPRSERPEWVRRLRLQRFDRLRGMSLDELHLGQVTWARLDAESYQKWLRDPAKSKDKHDAGAVIDGTWPLRPLPAPAEGATT